MVMGKIIFFKKLREDIDWQEKEKYFKWDIYGVVRWFTFFTKC
jgi:hypothetical protein